MSEQEPQRVILARLDERIAHIQLKVVKIDKTLHENGLIIHVDRNTQWRRSWRRWISSLIAFVAMAAAVVAVIIVYRKELP